MTALRAGVDYPRSDAEFQAWFGTDADLQLLSLLDSPIRAPFWPAWRMGWNRLSWSNTRTVLGDHPSDTVTLQGVKA